MMGPALKYWRTLSGWEKVLCVLASITVLVSLWLFTVAILLLSP